MSDLPKSEDPVSEPKDLSLDEQAEIQPANEMDSQTEDFATKASVADDGRINININYKTDTLNRFLPPADEVEPDKLKLDPLFFPDRDETNFRNPPALNIVVQIVGSRGDVQPFIALGKHLQAYGHRVRIATHPTFKTFVEETGLEFFSIGGDPAELMSYMVRNPSLIPSIKTLESGEIGRRRKMSYEMIEGCWKSCIENDFIADAIIANPPSFAHVHCAERLCIPVWIVFTMPWSPTMSFPHPLANIQSSNAEPRVTNYLSYILVEALTWQGLGDLVNRFRRRMLGLDEVAFTMGICLPSTLKVPHTYTWSPALIPKPLNWGDEIDISGFFFHSQPSYKPDASLTAFLDAGPPPIYIGFGSIVVDDPTTLTEKLLTTVSNLKIRALISKGWGGLDAKNVPENIYFLGNCPHDWLFPRVSAVVHHGGAGTTAIGLKCGKPTVVVSFFGDQKFWGEMVARAGAGPNPIPFKELTVQNLEEGIKVALSEKAQSAAKEMSARIDKEEGVEHAVDGFHRLLPLKRMRCSILPERVAVWTIPNTTFRISNLAAGVLDKERKLKLKDLVLTRHKLYDTENQQWDPVTGSIAAAIGSGVDLTKSLAKLPVNPPDGIVKLVSFPLKATAEMHVALTQGFQNVPRLYGDDNIRRSGKVTGIASGLVEAAKGFTLGLGDAAMSVFEQPYLGAQKEGGVGFLKGAAKGIAGMYMKGGAAVYAVPARITQGVWMEFQKRLYFEQEDVILGQRREEAYEEASKVDGRTREEILGKWKDIKIEKIPTENKKSQEGERPQVGERPQEGERPSTRWLDARNRSLQENEGPSKRWLDARNTNSEDQAQETGG